MQKLAGLLLIALLTSACVFPGVYKINVQQGNILSADDLAKLKPGMTRKEVHYLLGTPLMTDPVDADREYYIYTFQKAGGAVRQQRVMLLYVEGRYQEQNSELLEKTPAY